MRTVLAVLLLVPLAATAQDAPSWGRLSDADKALTEAPGDPDAGAVVLWDGGDAEVRLIRRDRFEMEIERHVRVKVLQESGYDLGEFRLVYGEGSDIQRVRGQTFVPQPDGTYEEVELDRGSIVEEEVRDGVREVRFSMPALAPGAIFEVSYRRELDGLLQPPVWYFQTSEPTLASRFRFRTPEFFEYVTYAQGAHVQATPPERFRVVDWEGTRYEWTAQNVPALREEPYTTTEEDYIDKVELQLRAVRPPDGVPRPVLGSWESVTEDLEDHPRFGRRLRRNDRVAELAATVSGTDAEKARALYDLVRTEFVWNRRGGIFAERDLDAVVETRGGTAGELGLLLLALLREADVPAAPILLSSRSNGRILRQYPILSRFNHLLVLAQPEGGDPALLDPTDPNRPYNMPPVDALSGEGWLADADRAQWIAFGPPTNSTTRTAVTGTLGLDGRLEGEMSLRLDGYPALALRTRLDDEAADAPAASAEATEEAAAEAADATDSVALDLGVVSVEGVDDPDVPVSVRAPFTAQAAEVVGDEMYLTPFVAMQLDENPFERPTRTFPVDFAYPSTRTYTASFTVPEGYVPESLPESVRMAIPSRSVSYARRVGFANGQLQIQTVLEIAASSVMPEEYEALRALYDEVVAAETEAIVLVRAPDAAAPEAAPATGTTGR